MDLQKELYENQICSMVGKQLMHHYPDWEWYVECDIFSGMASVRNLSCDGEYGFYIPLNKLLNETDPKIVMRAGGEILERFHQHRGRRTDHSINKQDADYGD